MSALALLNQTRVGPVELMPVAVESLRASSSFDFRLYLATDRGDYRLYRDRHIPISQGDLDGLTARGTNVLYVCSQEAQAYREHINKHVLGDNRVPLNERFLMLQRSTRALFLDSLKRHDRQELAQTSGAIARRLVEMICDSPCLLCDLFGVMQCDYSAFSHAIHVSTFSVLLARQWGIAPRRELKQIAQAALLHDIGKHEPALNEGAKAGADYQQDEYLKRMHPTLGFKKFAVGRELSRPQLMMIYQHHERCDGTGYPVGWVASEIHPWSRLCAIANATAKLLRGQPASRERLMEAERLLRSQAGAWFDKDMVACWISALKNRRCRV